MDNLRSLVMPTALPLRRLLILVGANGMGKSTYARLFPLLRQSMGTRTREPILWWDKEGVDFGSFAEAVRRGEEEIQFRFEISNVSNVKYTAVARLRGNENSCYVKGWNFRGGYEEFSVEIDDNSSTKNASFTLNNHKINLDSTIWSAPSHHASLLFDIDFKKQQTLWRNLLDPLFHGNTEMERRFSIADKLLANPNDILYSLASEKLGKKYHSAVLKLATDLTQLELLSNAREITRLTTLFPMTEFLLNEFAQNTAYLGPFRSLPERQYRSQQLAIETLDPRGSNLVMFLVALTAEEVADLNQFLNEHLNFQLRIRPDGSQHCVDLYLRQQWYNIVDVGFGYSQLLPVAVQIWAATRVLTFQRRKNPLHCLVIEQPELHLHPHHQALLARALVASAAQATGPVQIIETHSSALIEEVGLLIARGKIAPERVGVACVEPHPSGGARIREANYDQDGVLNNWPVGFLSP